jgi:hypothetical protein
VKYQGPNRLWRENDRGRLNMPRQNLVPDPTRSLGKTVYALLSRPQSWQAMGIISPIACDSPSATILNLFPERTFRQSHPAISMSLHDVIESRQRLA